MTQTELNQLLAQVLDEARALSIPVSPLICPAVVVNRRAKTRFGCCVRKDGGFTIQLAARLADGEPWAARRVLAHEVLHTCPGCSDHGPRWKSYAARMNAAYGYGIRRTNTPAELGLTDDRPVRYQVVCAACGARIPRMKRSALVDHPERYRCRCGGKLYTEALF